MRPAQPLLRICDPDPDLFQNEFVRPRVPVILTEAAMARVLAPAWSPERVASVTGEHVFNFKSSSSNAHPDFRAPTIGEMFAQRKLTFDEFLEVILHGPREQRSRLIFTGDEHFLARVRNGCLSINPHLAGLWVDQALPKWLPPDRLYSAWAWFSGEGARTWLHYDNNGCHNLNFQIYGSKRCTLFAPDLLEVLDFFPVEGDNPALNCSRLDVDAPEVNDVLQTLDRYDAELGAGDCLFIPAHWIHTFRHQGDYNANFNFWWKPDPRSEDLRQDDPTLSGNPVVRREAEIHAWVSRQSVAVAPDRGAK